MKKRWVIVIAVCLFAGVACLIVGTTVRDTSPLKVGSTPDEAWTYIHSSGAWGSGTPNLIGVSQSHQWTADAGCIFRETRFRWRRTPPFAIRKTTFYYGTNDTIRRVTAGWKYEWPFAAKAAAIPRNPAYFISIGTNGIAYPLDRRARQLMREASEMTDAPKPDAPFFAPGK